ncbi:Retrovirus-related Pol polyprotein from transposon RE1 [Sesamum angolense]|uniref:Retrovirus-related Pol polyprotein from transposon RE1 n=1 Tax=Sesamum angolense TaxID=2727404 RepID=A0AAE1X0I3_9LAMI|nr:Retrovirus-related Pol polyprotein from transposon RE1 [Sesamum angolense]
MAIVTAPMDGMNYMAWSRAIKLTLRGRMKLCFIDGTSKKLAKEHENYDKWIRVDNMILVMESLPSVTRHSTWCKEVEKQRKMSSTSVSTKGVALNVRWSGHRGHDQGQENLKREMWLIRNHDSALTVTRHVIQGKHASNCTVTLSGTWHDLDFLNANNSSFWIVDTDIPSSIPTPTTFSLVPAPRRTLRHTTPLAWLQDYICNHSTYSTDPYPSSVFTLAHRSFLANVAAIQEPREEGSWIPLDVNNIFLHGYLEEEVYMTAPNEYLRAQPNQVCRLKRSLYGWKQASRQWNIEFTSKFDSYGFTQPPHDHCIFTNGSGSSFLALLVYAEDVLIINPS